MIKLCRSKDKVDEAMLRYLNCIPDLVNEYMPTFNAEQQKNISGMVQCYFYFVLFDQKWRYCYSRLDRSDGMFRFYN